MYLRVSVVPVIVIVVATISLGGCWSSKEIAHVRRDIESEIPGAEFRKEAEVTVESGAFFTVGRILGRVADNEDLYEAGRYIQELRRIKVGVYRVEKLPSDDQINMFDLRRFDEGGWAPATFVEQDDEAIWVLYREWYDEIRDMMIIVLNDDELVVVRIEGALDHLLEKIVEDNDFVAGVFGQTRHWDRPPHAGF
jgi:Domain of unknown function (DUF4252)